MGVDDRDGVAPTRRATDHLQEGTPQTFAELVVLVMQNSERLDALEEQLDALKEGLKVLQAWIAAYPPDRLLEDFAGLIRTAIDEYRTTEEQALKELAQAVHEEITALQGGDTSAQEALTALTAEVHDLSIKLDVPVDLETKAALSVDVARQSAALAKGAQEALRTTLYEFKEYRAAEMQRDTFVDTLMRNERKRQRQERLREARSARREAALRQTIGTLQPVALLILGYISNSGLALVGALPKNISSVVDVVIFVAVLVLLVWQGWGGATRALRTSRQNGGPHPRRRLDDGVDDDEAEGADEEEEDDADTQA